MFSACLFFLTAVSSQAQTLTVENGTEMKLGGDAVLDLGTATTLQETSGGRIAGNGTITATRTLQAPVQQNVAGLGLYVSTTATLGTTVVTRGHATQTGPDGITSIERYFDVEPQQANSNLDADLRMDYFADELGGLSETDLVMGLSDSSEQSYTLRRESTVFPEENYLVVSGVSALHRVTAFGVTNSSPLVAVSIPDTTMDKDDAALTLTLTDYFSDPDADALSFAAASSEASTADVSISSDNLTVNAAAVGDVTITVTAEDEYGASVSDDFLLTVTDGVAIEQPDDLPKEVTLYQNAPNPFSLQTTIRYALPEPADVDIAVYNVLGQMVRQVVATRQAAGWHDASISSETLPSGIYFYRLKSAEYDIVRKMMIVK